MKIYQLNPYTKDSLTLRAQASYYTEDYLRDHSDYYLTDKLINDYGHIEAYYQFHSQKRLSLNDTMAFTIECPKCHCHMKINRLSSNGHDHSWYYCPICNRKD